MKFTATATLSDGTTLSVTDSALWLSQNPVVATVQPGGIALAVGPGESQIVVHYQGLEASRKMQVSAVEFLTVTDHKLRPYVSIGSTAQLSATANLKNGIQKTVTATALWQSSNAAVATVSADGSVTGVTAGRAEIRVSLGGVTEVAQVWVPVAGCAYSASPAKIVPDGSFGGSTLGFEVAVDATAGCQWTATSQYPRFEVRAYESGPVVTGGTGSGRVFLQCVSEFDRCGSGIATFDVAGTHIVKYSKQ